MTNKTRLAIYSKGIRKIPYLAEFLNEYEVLYKKDADAVAGWGMKKTAKKALKKSAKKSIPYIALEDGFVRSYGLGVHKNPPYSIVVDTKGIYYDATRPSLIEELIIKNSGADKIARARHAIMRIVEERISKYNCYSDNFPDKPKPNSVLIIDQCHGDASIKFGMADESSFKKMVEAAISENPGAEIIVKVHPDVIAGKRKGYIDLGKLENARIITESINPHIILDAVAKVYTVTSLLGFEAVLHKIPVRCFGMPFYAGWGFTQDEIKLDRRNVTRSVEEVFAAAYFDYARYVSPRTGERCELEDILDFITTVKDHERKNAVNYSCFGFSKWKQYFVKPYLKASTNKVKFFSDEAAAVRWAQKNNAELVVWAARETEKLRQLAGNIRICRMEDGFLRSVGLGSDFIPASSLILDKTGIHFNHSMPSDLENILNNITFCDELLARAKRLRESILSKSITKYNAEKTAASLDLPKGKKIILAVGQVEGDASIRLGSPDIKTNQELINAIRAAEPDAHIIYKPHPDVVSGNRKGSLEAENADAIITNVGIHSLVAQVDEVHTITSLVGFESLLHEKKVVVYGLPFYAGWGLTEDRIKHPRRNRKRTLDELVTAALIEYPGYYDFEAALPATPEVIVGKLASIEPLHVKNRIATRAKNGMVGILKRPF